MTEVIKQLCKTVPGDVHGKWTVVARSGSIRKKAAFLCRCECGTERVVIAHDLRRGASRSCGCVRHDTAIANLERANQSNRKRHRKASALREITEQRKQDRMAHWTFSCWKAIVKQKHHRVHPEWRRSYEAFWLSLPVRGSSYKDKCIALISESYGYVPGNVKWSTKQPTMIPQRQYRRIAKMLYAGVPSSVVAKKLNVPYYDVARIQKNCGIVQHTKFRGHQISEFGFRRLLKQQGNACPICERKFSDAVPANVDHCHTHGHVRGLLCVKCNTGLGHFNDDPERMMRALKYLRRDKTRRNLLQSAA